MAPEPRSGNPVAALQLAGEPAVVVRMSALGDVLLSTGVLEHWRQTRGSRVVFVTRDRFAPLLAGHPAVIHTVGCTAAQLHGAAWWGMARQLAKEFQGRTLIDLHGSLRSRMLSRLWSGPVLRYPTYAIERRLYVRWRTPRAGRLLLDADVPQRYAMALDRPAPPRKVLRPRLFLSPSEEEHARSLLRKAGIQGSLVALHPYATHPLKTWPAATWVDLVRQLDAAGWEWVVVGRDAHPLCSPADARRDLTNRTDLRITAAILAQASALVTPDSGPMHLAEAVGTPVIALFGPTSREWGFYPGGPRDVVVESSLPCRPCSLHGRARRACGQECLRGIAPSSIIVRLDELRSARIPHAAMPT